MRSGVCINQLETLWMYLHFQCIRIIMCSNYVSCEFTFFATFTFQACTSNLILYSHWTLKTSSNWYFIKYFKFYETWFLIVRFYEAWTLAGALLYFVKNFRHNFLWSEALLQNTKQETKSFLLFDYLETKKFFIVKNWMQISLVTLWSNVSTSSKILLVKKFQGGNNFHIQ